MYFYSIFLYSIAQQFSHLYSVYFNFWIFGNEKADIQMKHHLSYETEASEQ